MDEEKREEDQSLNEPPRRASTRSSPRRCGGSTGTKRPATEAPVAISPKRTRSSSSKDNDPAEVTPLKEGVDAGGNHTASSLGEDRPSTDKTEEDQVDTIPLFEEEVWPVLEKLQFVRERSTYRLPEHVERQVSFDSPEDLQRYLCSNGVPLLPGMEEVETNECGIELIQVWTSHMEEMAGEEREIVRIVETEVLSLRRWVRYSILLPLLENERSLPTSQAPIDKSQVKKDLKELGLMNVQSKYIVPGADGMEVETTFTKLELHIAQKGLPPHVLEKEELRDPALRVLLYVMENPELKTFILSPAKLVASRPARVKAKRPRLTCPSIEPLDEECPPLKKDGFYNRRKSRSRRDATIKDTRSLTRTVLLDKSEVTHIWDVMSRKPHLGRPHTLRADQFSWPYDKAFSNVQSARSFDESFSEGYLGFRHKIGRIYFNSFRIKGETFKVGDFVELQDNGNPLEVVRIISSFEATKSWTALRDYDTDEQAEYQKRGHGYIEVAPLVKGNGVWKLKGKSKDRPMHIDAQPRWLFDPTLKITKVDLTVLADGDIDRVAGGGGEGEGGVCVYSNEEEYTLLTEDAKTLCKHRIGYPWPNHWKAQQVLIVSREGNNGKCCGVPLFTDDGAQSSDDSDDALETDSLKDLADLQKKRAGLFWKKVPERPMPSVLLVGSVEAEPDTSKDDVEKVYYSNEDKPAVRRILAPHCRVRALLSITTQPNDNADYFDLLKEAQQLIGSGGSFRGLQGQVIHAAVESASPVIYLAPCGHGKTMTFLVPALREGGVTLVIEPLKELMRNQIEQLEKLDNGRGLFDVEQLLGVEDAAEFEKDSARTRLDYLRASYNNTGRPVRPRILFTGPEILKIHTGLFKALAPFLTRIVCDEFDAAEESGREAYDSLPSYLFDQFPKKKFMFLSGTATREESFRDFVSNGESLNPVVFMEPSIISPALQFSVERRKSFRQVASRIDQIVHIYEDKHPEERPKVLVYCTQKNFCREMVKYLGDVGRRVTEVTSTVSGEAKATVMKAFEDNHVQIVACTTVLGRGVHVKDIRFVFHTCCPMSLGSYIQEAGRAGRDGNESYCTLFYKPGDLSIVKSLCTNQGKKEDKCVTGDLSDLAKYCAQGHECRSKYLSRHAVQPFASHLDSIDDCGQCDVCQAKKEREGSQNRESINPLILQFLERPLDGNGNLSLRSCMEEARRNKSISEHAYLSLAEFGQDEGSLCEDILRLLSWLRVLSKRGYEDNFYTSFKSRVQNGQVEVILRWPDDDTCGMPEKPGPLSKAASSQPRPAAKIFDLQMAESPYLHQKEEGRRNIGDCLLLDTVQQRHYDDIEELLPPSAFLLRFEMTRLLAGKYEPDKTKLRKHRWRMESLDGQYKDWRFLHETFGATCDAGCESDIRSIAGSNLPIKNLDHALYFNAKYNVHSNKIDLLLPPRKAFDRLIFRKFGTDRFLHVDVEAASKHCSKIAVCDTLSRAVSLAGRELKLLWCKQTKNPQCYVLFAESGKGIGKNDELKVDNVWQWAIPPESNEGLTTEKAWKRMKLLFSKTTSAGVLPSGSIKIVDDIEEDGINRTDGCGLASAEAFDFMWRHYLRSIDPEQDEDTCCPWSSVQVRIGGIKGLLVLDESLDGLEIMCRESMKKFNLPMRSLECQDFSDGFDEAYDTVCVCNWANKKPENAHLNIRVIQQLEALAEREGNRDTLLELLFKCVDNGIGEVVKLPELWSNLRTRQAGMKQERGGDERSTLFHMENAGVAQDEPVRRQLFLKIQREEVKAMREKAKYPLPSTCYLWMIPDHTGLLEEGEAYVAIRDPSIKKATHCLAMRSPSYFLGDMRKLKLVNDKALEDRAKGLLDGQDKLKFFGGLEIGLVLSTKGQVCEADAMSGGDHDGDKAWVCWNDELVNLVSRVKPEDRSSDRFQKKESPENATKPFYQTKLRERMKYAMHFRYHQSQLGRLANDLDRIIDKHGFDDHQGIATEYGAQAFLQVDHPYFLCEVASETKEKADEIGWPHWHARAAGQDANTYLSNRALGLIFDRVEEFLNTREEIGTQPKPDSRILGYISKYESVSGIVHSMRAALRDEIGSWETTCWRWEEEEYVKKRSQLEVLSTKIGGHDREKLFAAVLYDEASKQSNLMLVRQVWFLFGPYLTQIINPTAFAMNVDGQKRILDGRRGKMS